MISPACQAGPLAPPWPHSPLASGGTRPDRLQRALFAVRSAAERADDGQRYTRAAIGLQTRATLRWCPYYTGRVDHRIGDGAGGGLVIPAFPGGSDGLSRLRKAALRHEPVVARKETGIKSNTRTQGIEGVLPM